MGTPREVGPSIRESSSPGGIVPMSRIGRTMYLMTLGVTWNDGALVLTAPRSRKARRCRPHSLSRPVFCFQGATSLWHVPSSGLWCHPRAPRGGSICRARRGVNLTTPPEAVNLSPGFPEDFFRDPSRPGTMPAAAAQSSPSGAVPTSPGTGSGAPAAPRRPRQAPTSMA